MKIAFAGTPSFGARMLSALLSSHPPFEIVRVYCQPAKPKGRGLEPAPCDVERTARTERLTVMTPERWSEEVISDLKHSGAETLVTAAYGLILPESALDALPLGCVNVHASLLPRWRGAAPIQRAIEAGDVESGVSIFKLDRGVDTGPILGSSRVPILETDTAVELTARIEAAAEELLPTILHRMNDGTACAIPQDDSKACRAKKLRREDGLLDWNLPASVICAKARAFHPWPGVSIGGVKLISIGISNGFGAPGEILSADPLIVAAGDGAVRIDHLQAPGKKAVMGRDYANGKRFAKGDRFA